MRTIVIENEMLMLKKKITHDYCVSSSDTQILDINKNLSSEYKIILHERRGGGSSCFHRAQSSTDAGHYESMGGI